MHSLVLPFFNFSILVGILVYKLRQPIREFVSQRHASIRDEILAVQNQLQAAQKQYNELTAKLKALDVEVQSIRNQSQQDLELMKRQILMEAKRASTALVADAKNSVDGMLTDLKAELYLSLGQSVLARAEELVRGRLTSEDKSRIQKEFSNQVEGIR